MAVAVAMMIGGAITNALAFSGSNYLFSHMGNNANDEKIRHDKAIEKLETAKTEWNKERIKRLDFLHEQEKKERQGAEEFINVDQAMKDYYYFTKKSPEPKLSDFYTPSEDQKKREIGFVAGMIVTGFIAWKISERSESK
jgi:hypothetical protein